MTDESDSNLKKAMAEAAKTIQEAHQPTAQVVYTDPQRLIDTGKRLLRQQQDRLINERSKYEAERTERSNWYRGEMAKLADEAEGEMTTLDKNWKKLGDEIDTIIRQIKALLSA